ncbi:MAG: lipid A biosynthesis (KDO)2-(lauroyl)-lipid IVA acyltransferase [Bacteroidales bacterium]|nr:lipid A biosynthesis (KDO)2-(lauroyl)-lipid IVA acyltransferase [Bacteroidales bacterium]
MASTTSDKWKGVTGGGSFGQRSLLFLFKHCDVRVGYAMMYIAMPFYLIFGGKARRAIMHYFQMVYGYGFWKSLWYSWRNYINFGKVMLDRFAVFAGQKQKFEVEEDSMQYFSELMDKPDGFMMVGSHTGNFEICGYLLRQDIKKIYALVFGGESEVLQRQRYAQMSQNNVEMVPVADDMSHLFVINEALQSGGIVSMPADRIFGSAKSVTCHFGKAVADFPVGPFSVAAIRGVPVLAVFVFRIAAYRYRVVVRKVDVDNGIRPSKLKAEAMAKEYVKLLESQVREHQCQWFNFFEFFRLKE